MYIRLDVFADMLDIKPAELLQAARTTGHLAGIPLPFHRQVRGAMVMFRQDQATSFINKWQRRPSVTPPPVSGGPLIPLEVFARKAGIVPLALWQAVRCRKFIKGVPVPSPIKSYENHLMFEPDSVRIFISEYRKIMIKK